MKNRIKATGVAALVVSAIVSAPHAAAAPSEWVMPDLADVSLAKAQKMFTDATEGSGLTLNIINNSDSPATFLSAANWTTCSQGPDAGETITAESWVGVAVDRWNQCWT